MHRLDKLTSGVQIFGKNLETLNLFRKAFEDNEYQKSYFARVSGKIEKKEFTVDRNIYCSDKQKFIHDDCDEDKGKKCITDFKLIYYDEENDTSLLECKLKRHSKDRKDTPDQGSFKIHKTSDSQ